MAQPPSPAAQAALGRAKELLTTGDVPGALTVFRDAAGALGASGDHRGASIVAHMAGVAETNDAERKRWDELALREAELVTDRASVADFYPSLYNNLAFSSMKLGDRDGALRFIRLAWAHVGDLEPGPYGDRVRATIRSRLDELEARP